MPILAVGIDPTTVEFLRSQGSNLEVVEDVEDFDLEDWLVPDSIYTAALLNLDIGIGVYACRGIRQNGVTTPVVGLSTGLIDGKSNWSETRANYLDHGGDDLIRTPCNPREVAATLRAVTRRSLGSLTSVVSLHTRWGTLKINQTNKQVTFNDIAIYTTKMEYTVLSLLGSAPNKIFTKEQIMLHLYSGGSEADEPEMKIIDVWICKIRNKITEIVAEAGEANPDSTGILKTVWGRGYMLEGETSKAAESRLTDNG